MNAPYVRLGITLGLGAAAMFLILEATIGALGGADLILAWIALMLIAPMGVLMLLVMPHLYRSLRANLILFVGFTCLFLGAWAATRSAALAGEQDALRGSMALAGARAIG